jgi:hypothetical protein
MLSADHHAAARPADPAEPPSPRDGTAHGIGSGARTGASAREQLLVDLARALARDDDCVDADGAGIGL